MSEPLAVYAPPLPARALNMARRVLQMESECGGRGRLAVDIVFADGQWFLSFAPPVVLERLGESIDVIQRIH